MLSASPLGIEALLRASGVSAELCALPAVPTMDWCDRAAEILCTCVPGSTAVVLVGGVDSAGVIGTREAIGVGSDAPLEVVADNAQLESLRSRAFRLGGLGAPPGGWGPPWPRVVSLDRIEPTWRQGGMGRLWLGGRHDVLVSLMPLGVEAGRMIAVVLAPPIGEGGASAELLLWAAMPRLVERAERALGVRPCPARQWISPREQEVLEHLVLGRSVKQIAGALSRSPHTVHDHIKSLHRKLGAKTRGELIARVMGLGSSPASGTVEPKPTRAEVQAGRAETMGGLGAAPAMELAVSGGAPATPGGAPGWVGKARRLETSAMERTIGGSH